MELTFEWLPELRNYSRRRRNPTVTGERISTASGRIRRVHGIFREEEWYRVRAVSLTSLAEQAGDVGLFSYVSSKKEMEEKIMMNYKKYQKQYFMPPVPCYDWVKKDSIDHAPVWCSVDLRDGNQALVIPMDLDTKIEFFKLLCKVGFKEIEVGFPAASETEYVFLRRLIEENLIPDDVTVQVLTQAREEGAELLQKLTEEENESYRFEYSPESFTGTEPEYALEVCNAVLDVWKPTADRKAIINLPSTVELSMPHVYASQVEYMSKNLKCRDNVVLSLHPHNDRGCGVSDAELGVLAGADRVEGTLFGNGERTGNVDIITLAMNLYMQGVNPEMNFDNMKDLVDRYEEYTGMQVGPRTPYCGSLVFAAFSGSHQDAIAKGMHWREEHDPDHWTVPYLPIDPTDIGRSYDADVIRINSQSGKGGVGYVLETHYDLILPKKMREAMGYAAKDLSDHLHKELKPDEIFSLFKQTFEDKNSPLTVNGVHFRQLDSGRIEASVNSRYGDGEFAVTKAEGNGRLDAVSNALKKAHGLDYTLTTYQEHALTKSSSSNAIAYVGIQEKNGTMSWGAAVDPDIIRASIDALVTAVNNS